MNSYPSIENLPYTPSVNGGSREAGILPYGERDDEDEWQQVDSHRLARISRGQARYEGALSEAATAAGELRSDLVY